MIDLQPGARARVEVPATSANLGPGFDSLGLALDLRDEYEVEILAQGVEVVCRGEGAQDLPTDRTHLVARSLITGLGLAGVSQPGFALTCTNRIPQGRGMGSSSAAIVGGLALAAALAGRQDDAALIAAASDIEGHPDNVAPATLGGLVISWLDDQGTARAQRVVIHPDVAVVLFVPEATSPTHTARQLLPATVPFADAVFNASRSALLIAALTQDPTRLWEATADRLHQEQRRANYPQSMAFVDHLRAQGHAAAISGAGPAVLVLTTGERQAGVLAAPAEGFTSLAVGIAAGVAATRITAWPS